MVARRAGDERDAVVGAPAAVGDRGRAVEIGGVGGGGAVIDRVLASERARSEQVAPTRKTLKPIVRPIPMRPKLVTRSTIFRNCRHK
jgi:hypothetical protein